MVLFQLFIVTPPIFMHIFYEFSIRARSYLVQIELHIDLFILNLHCLLRIRYSKLVFLFFFFNFNLFRSCFFPKKLFYISLHGNAKSKEYDLRRHYPLLNHRSIIQIFIVMRRKQIDFQQQMKNSEQFLQKLETLKKTSQDIKQKNKLQLHRNIWVKQVKYLARLERDADTDIAQCLSRIDTYLRPQFTERGIFSKQGPQSYCEMKESLDEQLAHFETDIFKQLESLPLLLQTSKASKTEINEEIKEIVDDIGRLLLSHRVQCPVQEDEMLQVAGDDVKGFDFGVQRVRRIEEGEKHLEEYLSSMEEKLSADDILQVLNQFKLASSLLQQTLQLQLENISLDYEEALGFDHEALHRDNLYQRLAHIYHIYIGRGRSLAHYYERLTIEAPRMPRQLLDKVTGLIEAHVYKDRKSKAARRNYLREREELLGKVEKEVNLRIERRIEKALKEAEMLARREDRLKLEKQLQTLREDYQRRENHKQQAYQAEEQARLQAEKKKQAVRKLYLEDLNRKAEQISHIKQEKQAEEEQKDRVRVAKEENEKKKHIEANKPKVQERHSLERIKLEKKLTSQAEQKRDKLQEEERVRKAIQKYGFRPKVEGSEQRLQAPTASLIKKQTTLYDKADKIDLNKNQGYSVQQLMGDMRFRLNAALQQAGLANTDYARQVINSMSKPKQ